MSRSCRSLILFAGIGLLFCCALASAGFAQDPDEDEQDLLGYKVHIEGVEDSQILEILEKTSVLESLKDTPPSSDVMLLRRIEDDQTRFQTVLRSEGFYEATVSHSIDRAVTPYDITFMITPGRRFTLEAFTIHYVGKDAQSAGPPPSDLEALGLKIGMPAQADAIVSAQTRLLRQLADNGHPLAEVADRKAVVDHADGDMTVDLEVDPGPKARFGELTIEGLDQTKPAYLQRVLAWQPGLPYDQRRVDELRRQLVDMGIFDTVKISVPKELDDSDELPVQVSVIEGKARTIGFGVSYSTDEGFGGEIFWRHRNFFGAQESLKVTATLSEIRQALALDIEKPNFLAIDQSLLLNGTLLHQQSDAFDEKSASAFVGLKRKIDENWEVTYGVAPEYSKVDDNDGEETWVGAAIPVRLRHDTTDNALDPTTGQRFLLSVAPTIGELSKFTKFIRTEFRPSIYFAPFPTDRVIFAARGRIGSIIGEDTDEVPANHRFYAGGGGSIRGYEFQTVGPLDNDDDPVGGRSVVEVGAELRLRATETIGIVPFIDGGTAYDSSIPDADREIRWAAGLGLRYFTAIGPLRLDFAFPLNRRKGIDDSFQFYVSIGQAF